MLTCAPVLAIAVGLIFALETVPAARAQVTIDVSKITCNQFVDREVGDPREIAIWLSGYYHGKRGDTTVDKVKLLNKYVKEVRRTVIAALNIDDCRYAGCGTHASSLRYA